MSRFYVKDKDDKWNVFSTDAGEYVFSNFIEYDVMEQILVGATVQDKIGELRTLLTPNPVLKVETAEQIEKYIELQKKGNKI
jgi:hypothetical protein